MTSNGKIVDGTVIGGSGRAADAKESLLGSVLNGTGLQEKHKQSLAEAIRKAMKIRQEDAKWGKPGSGEMEIRRQGILHRPNPIDQRRYEVAKANHDRVVLTGLHLSELERFAGCGKKSVIELLRYVMAMDEELPEELQPIGLELTQIIAEVVTGTFTEGLTMLGQRGLEQINQATNGKDTDGFLPLV
jgi:hypothetical protein